MPPSAAPEWLRVGCSFETMATSAPASNAAMAARMPAQPAPTTRTSCVPSIRAEPIGKPGPGASDPRPGRPDVLVGVRELLEVLAEHLGELLRLAVVRLRVAPGRARV